MHTRIWQVVKRKELLEVKEQQLNGIRQSYEQQIRDLQHELREMRQTHARRRLTEAQGV